MIINIDRQSGFCFGVQNAVGIAEKALLAGEKVYSLGPIVHNDKEVERLSLIGLKTIDHAGFRKLRDCKVLIRAHGEPPETYRIASQNNITIIEATCPIVKKLQSRIRDTWMKLSESNGQVVIFGKAGHAEVVGLLGQIGNEGILVSGKGDLDKIDYTRPIHIFSQTTMGISDYREFTDAVKSRIIEAGKDPDLVLKVSNSICGQVSNREPSLKLFAGKHDVIIFVSGRESSNGKLLFSVCREVNPDSHFISSADEIKEEWFAGRSSVGICGATSTPKWLIENVRDHIASVHG